MRSAFDAFLGELDKIAKESRKKESRGRQYMKAVGAGVPIALAQSAFDIPEGMVERSVETAIRKGKPAFGGGLGVARAASRLPVSVWTTPLFLSGMKDVATAKNKKDENKGVGKVMASGALYAGLRGGLESTMDPALRKIPLGQKVKRVAGTRALMGIGSAAITAKTIGKSLQKGPKKPKKHRFQTPKALKKQRRKKFFKENVAPAGVGAVLAGGKGAFEEVTLKGMKSFKTPKGLRGIAAKSGGRAAAGAASTLFLSKLMKRMINKQNKPPKMKKAEANVPLGPSSSQIYEGVRGWASGRDEPDIVAAYNDIRKTEPERTPSRRAAYYALHDEMKHRGHAPAAPRMRSQVREKGRPVSGVDIGLAASVAAAPHLVWSYISSMPADDRDMVLRDSLDKLYIQDRFLVEHVAKGNEGFEPGARKLHLSPKSGAATVAHEIGHARHGKLRAATIASPEALKAYQISSAMAIVLPLIAMGSASDPSFATAKELKKRARFVEGVGVISAALAAPNLAEEGVASLKGMAYLARAGATRNEVIRKGLTKLLPAFGTYAAPLAVPLIASRLLRRRANQEKR